MWWMIGAVVWLALAVLGMAFFAGAGRSRDGSGED